MKFITWNVNGLRACIKKGFWDFFETADADFFCVQETKMQQSQFEHEPCGYLQFWNDAEKKGYSGTAVFTKHEPLNVQLDFGNVHTTEGRVITLEYEKFYLINAYIPNSQHELARLGYRMQWEDDFLAYVKTLGKPVIYCGDLNVAHKEIDLKHPKTNTRNAGFTAEERGKLDALLENAALTDAFRRLYPDVEGAYTWWSYMRGARENNSGWRIDYFLVSDEITAQIDDVIIYKDILGSDHCPVQLTINNEQ